MSETKPALKAVQKSDSTATGKRRRSKEEWEIIKLKAEIRKIRQETSTKKKARSRSDLLKDWLSTATTIIGICGGLAGLFYGIQTYSEHKKTEEENIADDRRFKFNEKMVEYVDKLETDTAVSRAIMVLNYFGKDAVPILLYKLERTSATNNQNIISAILEIEKDVNDRDVVRKKIFSNMLNVFIYGKKTDLGTEDINPLLNYLSLSTKLTPRPPDSVLQVVENQINQVTDSVTRQDLFYEFNQIHKK